MIGPLTIYQAGQGCKYEAICWHSECRWSYHKWTYNEAKDLLLWHVDTAHVDPPTYVDSENRAGIGGRQWEKILQKNQ